jgi:hypothetical protein
MQPSRAALSLSSPSETNCALMRSRSDRLGVDCSWAFGILSRESNELKFKFCALSAQPDCLLSILMIAQQRFEHAENGETFRLVYI